MLWTWIASLGRFLLRLVLPPPAGLPKIDVHAPCPGCGHRDGKLELLTTPQGTVVKHTCAVCCARWAEDTVVDPKLWVAPVVNPRKVG